MIGKLTLGQGAAALIRYCYYAKDEQGKLRDIVRGELLYSNDLYEARLPNARLDIPAIAHQYHKIARVNTKTTKFVWHQTLNFHPEEKVSNEMMVKLAREFAQAFGFEHNQYLVFRHRDRANDHFHIIANRVSAEGENTASDRMNYERIQVWCRQMENKYGLRVTENHRQKIDARHNRSNYQVDALRKVLDELLPACQTMSELSLALRRKNITMYLGRGVSFTNKSSGASFKGSDLGRDYSRAGLERRLGRAENRESSSQNTTLCFDGSKRQALRDTIDRAVSVSPTLQLGNKALEASAWKVFGARLKTEGITLHLERTPSSGSITDVAFQAEGNRFVNGGELGEHYSHWVLAMRFGRTPEEFAQLVEQLMAQRGDVRGQTTHEEGPGWPMGETSKSDPTRMIASTNSAYETREDLARIAQSLRAVAPKKRQRKL